MNRSKLKNIILITVDCLRPDYLGCYGFNRDTSPVIDELGKNGVILKNAFAHGNATPVSFPSIFTSTLPLSYGGFNYLSSERKSFVEVLNSVGYKTCAFQTNFWMSHHSNYTKGFDQYIEFQDSYKQLKKWKESSKRKILKKIILKCGYRCVEKIRNIFGILHFKTKPWVDSETVTDKVLEWIKHNSYEPYFLWIHFMDVHGPNLPGGNNKWWEEMENYISKVGYQKISKKDADNQKNKVLISLYATCVRYVDDCIGQLINYLEKNKKETLVIITSDHGEELFEHGIKGHGAVLYDTLIKVPMIFSNINGKCLPNVDDEKLVGHMDIAPSIFHLCKINSRIGEGNNIFSPMERNFIFSETLESKEKFNEGIRYKQGLDYSNDYLMLSVRTNTKKLIYQESTNEYHYYDLVNDPKEQNTLDLKDTDFFSMKELIDARFSEIRMKDQVGWDATEEEKREIEDRLRALGYLG